jgi:hypothetical protein
LPELALQLTDGTRARTAIVRFPTVRIRSVLPPDTAGIEPQPPHDVLGPNRVWWPLVLAGVSALLALAALLWWWRRRARRADPAPAAPTVSPRDAALAALEAARHSGALEAGAYRHFYSDVSDVLRMYVAALDPVLGPDLTTTELTARLHTTGRAGSARDLGAVLRAADHVKFARHQPDVPAALSHWEQARAFVTTFDGAGAGEARAA